MAHYFTDDKVQDTHEINFSVLGKQFRLLSAPGMFSKDDLDTGTRVLLENMQLPESGNVLDLGCGIGVVGIVVKTVRPELLVTQSDVTTKAMVLTQKNVRALHLETTITKSDVYEKLSGEFDCILVNPPRAAGKAVIKEMIYGAVEKLTSRGSLQLVALTNKGGKSYENMMHDAFGNVEKIGRGSGFSVYCSVRT